MITFDSLTVTDQTRLIDLTVGDLKKIIREIVQDEVTLAVLELEQQLPDPDEGKEFKPEVAEQLRQYLRDKPEGKAAEDVMQELGLLDD